MWKNSLYNTIGGLVKLALGLISVPFLTRNLGIETYGLYAIINAIINIALFSEWSVSTAVTVFIAKEITFTDSTAGKPEKYTALSISAFFVIGLSVSTAAVIFVSASSISSFFENLNPAQKYILEKAIKIGTGVTLARFIHQFFIGVLQAHKAYGLVNLLSTSYTIVSITSTLYIAGTTKDLIQIQFAQLIISSLMIGVYWVCCQQGSYLYLRFFTKPILRELSELTKYGLRMWLSALGSTLFSQFDRLIVLRLFGAELAGLYAALTSLANQINVVSSMPIQPLLPIMSEYRETISTTLKTKLESTLSKAFTVNACLIVLATITLTFFSNQIVAVLFTKYSLSGSTVQMCLILIVSAYSLYSFNAAGYFTLLAIREERFVTQVVVFSGLITLSLIYVLSLKFGIIGACCGNIGYSFTLLLNARALRKLQVNIYNALSGVGIIVLISIVFFLLNVIFNNLKITIVLYMLFISVIFIFMERRFNIIALIKSREIL